MRLCRDGLRLRVAAALAGIEPRALLGAGALAQNDATVPRVLAGALHDEPRGGRRDARVLRACVLVQPHQVVDARLQPVGADGVGAVVLLADDTLAARHDAPALRIQCDAQGRERLEALAAAVGHRARVIFLRPEGQRAALPDRVVVLVEAGKGAAVRPEIPIAEHGQIDRVAVGQQNVVRRRAPCRAHQREDMVAIVHEVFVVPPELLHIKGGGAACNVQRAGARRVGVFLGVEHVRNQPSLGKVQQPRGALAALCGGQTDVIPLEKINVKMQQCRPLDQHVVHVASALRVGMIAVKVAQAVGLQRKVRNVDRQVCQRRAVVVRPAQRDAVIRQGDLHAHAGLIALVVVILRLVAARRFGNGQRELRPRRAAARAGRSHSQTVLPRLRGRKIQHVILDDCPPAAVLRQRKGQRMAVRVGKDLRQRQPEQLSRGKGLRLRCGHGQRAIRRRSRRKHAQQQRQGQEKCKIASFHRLNPFFFKHKNTPEGEKQQNFSLGRPAAPGLPRHRKKKQKSVVGIVRLSPQPIRAK